MAPDQKSYNPDPDVRRLVIINAIESDRETALRLILSGFDDTSSAVREEAARAIADIPGDYMLVPLLKLLEDSDENVRMVAADTLSECNLKEFGDIYEEWITNKNDFVRSSVLRALRPLRIPGVAIYALKGLHDLSQQVRLESVGVLGYLQNPAYAHDLSKIAVSDVSEEVRRVAIGAIGYSLTPETLAAALQGLHDKEWQVRAEAAGTIAKLGADGVCDEVVKVMSTEAQWQVISKILVAIGKIKCHAVVSEVIKMLTYPVSNVRKEAAMCLGEIGNPVAIASLRDALLDRDPDVKKIAAWAIAKLQAI